MRLTAILIGIFVLTIVAGVVTYQRDDVPVVSTRADGSTAVEPDVVSVPGEAGAEPEHQRVTLRGRVVSPTREPVEGAAISSWIAIDSPEPCASVPRGTHVTSDPSGAFIIELDGGQLYCIAASHDRWSSSTPVLVASADASGADVELTLADAMHVAGRIVDSDFGGQLKLTSAGGKVTATRVSEAGEFRFEGLASGDYRLVSSDPRYTVEEPQLIRLTTESIENLDVRMFPAAMVRGRVVSRSGVPLAGVQVTARLPFMDRLEVGRASTNANGAFELKSTHLSQAAAERRRMIAGAEGFEAGPARAVSPIEQICLSLQHAAHVAREHLIRVEGAATDVGTLQLERGGDVIRGVVRNHRNEPLTAQLTFRPVLAPNADESSCAAADELSAQADQQGRFVVHHLNASVRYEVEVRTDRYQPQIVSVDPAATSDLEIRLK